MTIGYIDDGGFVTDEKGARKIDHHGLWIFIEKEHRHHFVNVDDAQRFKKLKLKYYPHPLCISIFLDTLCQCMSGF